MEKRTVLTLASAARWDQALARTTGRSEPYYQAAFYAAAAGETEGRAECFVFEADGETAVYPYLRRRLAALPFMEPSSPLSDITGAYGYNGAMASTSDDIFARRFREAFGTYCRESGVITEFVRFHPLLGNAELFASDCTIQVANDNVAVDLRRPLSEIRETYAYNCRKNLRKAEREGVRAYIEEGNGASFGDFLRIYRETMERVEAEPSFAYSDAFFEHLAEDLRPVPIFAYAEFGERVVSCELALRSDRIIYSFLGGTDPNAFSVRPNNALKDELIRWAQQHGCEWYLIGGGRRPGDGIFNYKASFAPAGAIPFEVGVRVHDPLAYEQVIARWEVAVPDCDLHDRRLQRYWTVSAPAGQEGAA